MQTSYDPLSDMEEYFGTPDVSSEPNDSYGKPQQLDPLELAYKLAEDTGVNIFLTGKAGTGKTTFLRRLRDKTSKRMVVLAPTGVAAINAGGVTIHSFFQLPFTPYIPGTTQNREGHRFSFARNKRRLIRTLDLIVIDEISMVRPDVLDAVDSVMRRYRDRDKPFGGVQLLLIGDLRQLAPVVTPQEWSLLSPHYNSPYFFESRALKETGFITVELEKVFRQQDDNFIKILNQIRDNRLEPATLTALNQRAAIKPDDSTGIIRLTTHNAVADRINEANLQQLDTTPFVYEAEVDGEFQKYMFPADEKLTLKLGAQVMFIKNDPSPAKEYYNGLIGTVTHLQNDAVIVATHEAIPREITARQLIWENVKYSIDDKSAEVQTSVIGTFSQIPLRTAWAITIHKSQGLTFDRAIIDTAASFAPGQTYVALSRCRSLDGLYLDSPISPSAVITDNNISNFIKYQRQRVPDAGILHKFQLAYLIALAKNLFDFNQLVIALNGYNRTVNVELASTFPRFAARTNELANLFSNTVSDVAAKTYKFFDLIAPYLADPKKRELFNAKINGGCKYFKEYVDRIIHLLKADLPEIDNKATRKKIMKQAEEMLEQATMKSELLAAFAHKEFNPADFMQVKAAILLKFDFGDAGATTKRKATTWTERFDKAYNHTPESQKSQDNSLASPDDGAIPFHGMTEDIANPRIYSLLTKWRKETARQLNTECYKILPNRTLMNISAALPRNLKELGAVSGIGPKKLADYGEEIITLINTIENE